jgi:hypothetical protein
LTKTDKIIFAGSASGHLIPEALLNINKDVSNGGSQPEGLPEISRG